jgi:putative holliday junction resolvase
MMRSHELRWLPASLPVRERGGDAAAIVEVAALPRDGRLVGIDLGEVRVGIAVSDPAQIIASPVETVQIPRNDDEALVDALVKLLGRHEAAGAVIGHPRRLDGREGAAAQRSRRVAGALATRAGIAVALWDERFSTVEAERVLIADDLSRADRRKVVDRIAASVLLQAALDARRHAD